MILAAGLTPAWQQIMRFVRLRPGEVNRAAEVHWCASGKVVNAGMALAALGADARTLAPVGGWSGAAIAQEFTERGLPACWTTAQAPTRVCTTLLNDADASSTELVENAPALTEAELADFQVQYRRLAQTASMVVLTGSLPLGTPATFYRDLVDRTSCPVVLDARGPELLAALASRPRVVKPNREELASTVQRPLDDQASLLWAMRDLIERGAQSVIVTQGKTAVWAMEAGRGWRFSPPHVDPVVNPIGCGDCLAAALTLGLARGDTLVEAIRLGIAAASENVSQLLPARLSLSGVQAWLERVAAATPIAP